MSIIGIIWVYNWQDIEICLLQGFMRDGQLLEKEEIDKMQVTLSSFATSS